MFIALVQIEPQEGSTLDPRSVAGAFVRCYLPAPSRAEALDLLQRTLDEHHFLLVEVEWCAPADSEWEQEDDGADGRGIEEARQSNGMAYGTFHCWGHDAPDAPPHTV